MVVAVVDDGLNKDHPELSANYVSPDSIWVVTLMTKASNLRYRVIDV